MRQVPILMYHWFRGSTASKSRSPQLEISPERFERQMAFLRRAGYHACSLGEALAPASERRNTRPVVITFDDGTRDFLEHARPALARHGFGATLFVVSGHVGGESTWDRDLGEPPRALMTWEELAELQDAGFEIGSHTHSHRPLTTLDDAAALDELRNSRERIAERLGFPPRFLAYPRGCFAPHHRTLAREAGYGGACAVVLRWRDLRGSDRFALRRMTVKGAEGLLLFRLRLWLGGLVSLRGEG